MRAVVCILLVAFSFALSAQQSGRELVEKYTFTKKEFETKRKVEYLFKGKNWFVKYNPLSLFFGGSMLLYQSTISVQIGANCPYQVSCSAFSKACIRQYGIIKGIALSADRLTRCTRLAGIDLDELTDLDHKTHKIIDDPKDYTIK